MLKQQGSQAWLCDAVVVVFNRAVVVDVTNLQGGSMNSQSFSCRFLFERVTAVFLPAFKPLLQVTDGSWHISTDAFEESPNGFSAHAFRM